MYAYCSLLELVLDKLIKIKKEIKKRIACYQDSVLIIHSEEPLKRFDLFVNFTSLVSPGCHLSLASLSYINGFVSGLYCPIGMIVPD